MPGSSVPLGPFTGGLNLVDDPKLLADNELAVCQNFDVNPDGQLVVRSPLKLLSSIDVVDPASLPGSGVAAQYIIGTALQSDNVSRIYVWSYRDGFVYWQTGPSFVTPYNKQNGWPAGGNGAPSKVVQYNNYAWLIPTTGTVAVAQGFQSDMTVGTNGGATVPNMPMGSGAVIHKDRLFIFGPQNFNTFVATSRVYYSTATDFTSWPALNFFDINPGDGEGVTAAYATTDAIIFFKRHSTYILTFDTDPGLGTLRRLDSAIGCTGPNAVAVYQNSIYFISEQSIYRIVGYNIVEIGRKLGLRTQITNSAKNAFNQDFAYVLGARVIFAIHTGAQYVYYVYHAEVGAFSQYLLTEQPSRFYKVQSATHAEEMVASRIDNLKMYRMQPFGLTAAGDVIDGISALGDYPGNLLPVVITTKTFNFGEFEDFKRMFWWGAELETKNTSFTMRALHPDSLNVPTDTTYTSYGTATTFFKAKATKRSRWYNFTIKTDTNTTQNPFFRLISMMVSISRKAPVDAGSTT